MNDSRIVNWTFNSSAYTIRAEEVPVGGGRTIDIVAVRDGKRIGFEIETGKSDAAANVRKCLDVGLNKIIVVATSALVLDKLSGMLPKHSDVELVIASELLK